MSTKYLAYIGGFGSGKTYAGCLKSVLLAVANGNCAGMIVSPTYPMSRDITVRTLVGILEMLDIAYSYKVQNNVMYLGNGSEIWFRSADNPDRLKGSNLAWVGLDEAGQMNKNIWDVCISRVRDPQAKIKQIFVTTTPEGFNFLYDIFGVDKPDHKTIKARTEENIFVGVDYAKSLRENYDANLQKQYLDGDFVDITSGRVYYGFNRDMLIDSYSPDYSLPLIVTCDFNISPCCWIMLQEKDGVITVFDELIVRNANTNMMCDLLEEKQISNYTGVRFYGDYSSISQRSTASSFSDWQIIKNRFKNYNGFKLNLKANPKIKDSVNIVNNLLEKYKIFITRNCNAFIKDFEQVVWAENKAEIDKKKNPDLTHSSDAFRYYCSYEHSFNKTFSKVA